VDHLLQVIQLVRLDQHCLEGLGLATPVSQFGLQGIELGRNPAFFRRSSSPVDSRVLDMGENRTWNGSGQG
jgi:hypothetical protein